jgi:hypothetical protein
VKVVKATPTVKTKVAASAVKAGKKATVTVKVTAKGIAKPGGKVKLTWGKGKKNTKTVKVRATGTAKVTLPVLRPGTYTIKATYLGSGTVAKRAAKAVKLTVKPHR